MVQDLEVKNGPCHHRMLERAHKKQSTRSLQTPSCTTRRPPWRPTAWLSLPSPHSLPISKPLQWLDLQLSKPIAGEISSLGQHGAFSPASLQPKALSVHPWNSRMQRVISFQIWNRPRTLCKKHSQELECLKALTSRKRQTINLRPAWGQMEKEIQYTRSNLSINYGPMCAYQGLLKC